MRSCNLIPHGVCDTAMSALATVETDAQRELGETLRELLGRGTIDAISTALT